MPTYHCPTMIAPVVALGATPSFYPLLANGLPDLDYINASTEGPGKALLAAHYFGKPLPMKSVADFCRSHRMGFVEDCAHCFFGVSSDGPVGTSGDYAIGSLTKFFPVQEGGILASTRQPVPSLPQRISYRRELRQLWDAFDLAHRHNRLKRLGPVIRSVRLVRLRSRAAKNDTDRPLSPPVDVRSRSLSDPLLPPERLGRLDSLIMNATNMSANVAARRRTYHSLVSRLHDIGLSNWIAPGHLQCHESQVPYVLPLLIPSADLYFHMRQTGLPVLRWDTLWPTVSLDQSDHTSLWATRLVQLLCHQSFTDDDIDFIIHHMQAIASEAGRKGE